MFSIATLIPFGKENAISRNSLVKLTGLSDRKVREKIEEARADGFFIINDQDGKGYYRTFDFDTIKHQYLTDSKRAKTILKRLKHMRRYLKKNGVNVK